MFLKILKLLGSLGKYAKENTRVLNLVRWEINRTDFRQREFIRSLLETSDIKTTIYQQQQPTETTVLTGVSLVMFGKPITSVSFVQTLMEHSRKKACESKITSPRLLASSSVWTLLGHRRSCPPALRVLAGPDVIISHFQGL